MSLDEKGVLVLTKEHHDRILKEGGIVVEEALELAWNNYQSGALSRNEPVDETFLREAIPTIKDYINIALWD